MFEMLALSLCYFVVPTLMITFSLRRLRQTLLISLPLMLFCHLFFTCALSALTHIWWDFGFGKSAFVFAISSAASLISVHLLRPNFSEELAQQPRQGHTLALIALVSLVCSISLPYVLAQQGWFFAVPNKVPHFVFPFYGDHYRTVHLTTALLRGDGPPYAANSEWAYQIFWFHGSALLLSIFNSLQILNSRLSEYEVVQGANCALGLFFLFFVAWGIWLSRWRFFTKKRIAYIGLASIGLCHIDLAHYLVSWLLTGAANFEATGATIGSGFLRFASGKNTAMNSVQHAFGLIPIIVFCAIENFLQPSRMRTLFKYASATSSLLASPIFFVFFFFSYGLARLWRRKDRREVASKALIVLFASGLAYFVLLRHLPMRLFLRQGDPFTWPDPNSHWETLFLWFVSFGLQGLVFCALLLQSLRREWRATMTNYYFLIIGVAALVVHCVPANYELRRQFLIFCSGLIPIAIATLLPWEKFNPRILAAVAIFSVLIALYCEHFYVHSLSNSANFAAGIEHHHDYFTMNKIIREKYPGPVVSGRTPGIKYPIVAEVATALGDTSDVTTHSQLRPPAAGQGYKYLIWGPYEWSNPPLIKLMLSLYGHQPLATVGQVQLYSLSGLEVFP